MAFPDGGYFVMRYRWRGPTAVVHNGYSGSHGHKDANSIVIGIFDNQVVTDPGIWVYGTPESAELTATRSHPTMTVDGRDTKNGDYQNRWTSLSQFDYLDAINGGFEGSDVIHRRRVVFIKPDTWVICDQVKGSGEHRFDIRLPLDDASVADNGRGPPVSVNMLKDGCVVFPLDMTSAACLYPVETAGVEFKLEKGKTAQQQVDGQLRDIPVARYSRRAAARDQFKTMFVTVAATAFRATKLPDTDGAHAYRLDGLVTDGVVRLADPSTGPTPDTGECQVITHDLPKLAKPKVTSLFWVDGRVARDGKRLIAESQAPIAALQVRYDRGTLYIDAEGEDPTLRVWTQGTKTLVVNGGERRQIADGAEYVTPFARGRS
ncbi:hypothetical protein AMK68_04495 [candidate division KD3-62 bacterium DG_56]|uniref:Heparinase II/III-like C-terminal domain-containing protein n=1 Tax=candidate division KD3-62 bacterium DG_56 TaxID=1704032 RepID=A0A0S7XKL0_9BACT|nr:MAG: hypothetical protein AMK68_04495 [candidate division KD3-62 bacterium DG_56]